MSTAATESRVASQASQPITAAGSRAIAVLTHCESGTWWAESPTIPGFYASSDTRDNLMREVMELLDFAADDLPDATLAEAVRSGRFVVAATDAGSAQLTLGA